MAVSSVTILGPADGTVDQPATIARPAITFLWAGGTGSWDWEVIWDDDPTFANGNGNRQIKTGNAGSIAVTSVAPDSDLGDLSDGTTWYAKVTVWDTNDYQNEIQNVTNDATGGTFTLSFDGQGPTSAIGYDDTAANVESALEGLSNITNVTVTKNGTSDWDIEFNDPGNQDVAMMTADDTNLTGHTVGTTITEATKGNDGGPASDTSSFTLSDPNPSTRTWLYLLQNVGVGYTPTDDPSAGWGTGGTVGPDGDVIDFRRYLHLYQNIGVGYSKDEPLAGWGPNSPSTDAPDGFNIAFPRYLYALQNITTTQPCPFMYSLSRQQAETGDSVTVSGQGLVSASDPTDAYDAEVRLYATPDHAASYVVMTTLTWAAGETLDTITVQVPTGATSGYVSVVHTTGATCSGSNFLFLNVIAVPPDAQAGWWVEIWNLRNTSPVVRPLPDVAEATIEVIGNDAGRGDLRLPADHPDLAEIVDRTASPPVQRLVKVYQHNRFSYAFIPEDYDDEYDDDGAHLVRVYGEGQEGMLRWGRALWKDYPANPTSTRTWLYGSSDNAAEWGSFDPESELTNGGLEDANEDPWYAYGSASLFATTDEKQAGSYGLRVTITALSTDGAQIDVPVSGGQTAFVDGWVKNAEGGSKTFLAALVDEGGTTRDSQVVVVSTAAWAPFNLSWAPSSGQTATLRITQTVGAIGQFWVDSAAAYTSPGVALEATGCTYSLSRDYVADGLHSLKVAAEAGGTTAFKGVVGFIPVNPGEEYTLSVAIAGPAASTVRVAMRLGGTVDQVDQVLTGSPTFDVVQVTGTASATDTVARFAISSRNAAATTFYLDALSMLPGQAATSAGGIVLDVLAAIQARGTLDFVQTDFSATLASDGQAWPEQLQMEVPPEWTLFDLLEGLVGLGYDYQLAPVNWRAGGDTGWMLSLYGPLGAGIDYTIDTDGPVLLPGPALYDAKPSAAPPAETVTYGEGVNGIWSVAALSGAVLTALERREGFISNRAAVDTTTLFRALSHRLSVAETRGAAFTADITAQGDPLPWLDFVQQDRMRAHAPTDSDRPDHVPDATYRVAAMTAKLTAGGRYQQYAVDYGNYRLHAQRLRDMLQKRLLARSTTELYQPGTGRVGASGIGSGGTSSGGGSSSVGAETTTHTHPWSDVLPTTMGGDLSGFLPSPSVAGVRGIPVSTATPTTGQALIYDGAEWAPGTAGGGSLTQYEDIATSAVANLEIDSIAATGKDLVVTALLRSDTSAEFDGLEINVGDSGTIDTGSNYRWYRSYGGSASGNSSSESDTKLLAEGGVSAANADAGVYATLELTIFDYASTTREKFFQWRLSHWRATNFFWMLGYGEWRDTGAIAIVRLTPTSGQWVADSLMRITVR